MVHTLIDSFSFHLSFLLSFFLLSYSEFRYKYISLLILFIVAAAGVVVIVVLVESRLYWKGGVEGKGEGRQMYLSVVVFDQLFRAKLRMALPW